jgi:hypothetical protein
LIQKSDEKRAGRRESEEDCYDNDDDYDTHNTSQSSTEGETADASQSDPEAKAAGALQSGIEAKISCDETPSGTNTVILSPQDQQAIHLVRYQFKQSNP